MLKAALTAFVISLSTVRESSVTPVLMVLLKALLPASAAPSISAGSSSFRSIPNKVLTVISSACVGPKMYLVNSPCCAGSSIARSASSSPATYSSPLNLPDANAWASSKNPISSSAVVLSVAVPNSVRAVTSSRVRFAISLKPSATLSRLNTPSSAPCFSMLNMVSMLNPASLNCGAYSIRVSRKSPPWSSPFWKPKASKSPAS